MKSLIVSAVALFVAIAAQGCSSTNDASPRFCTPNAYVFCRCGDDSPGSKMCEADGLAFDTCMAVTGGECKGGEKPDPETGTVVKTPDPTTVTTPIASNDCPGQATNIDPGVTVTVTGDTTNATLDRQGKPGGACAVAVGSNDQVYHLVPSSSGSLKVEVQGDAALNPVIYLRTVCDDASAQSSCGPAGVDNLAQLKSNVAAKRDYYLFIDGASASVGTYTAKITLTGGAVCGDGIVDSGEVCDDGNNNENDGCSASCKNPNGNPTSGFSCPGQPVDLWALNTTVTGSGSNLSADGAYKGTWNAPNTSCSATGSNSSQDHIYAVTPHVTGTLTATVTPTDSNLMLVARTTCDTAASQVACANNGFSTVAETITLPVTSGTPVYVGVDGGSTTGNAGAYTIAFKIQ